MSRLRGWRGDVGMCVEREDGDVYLIVSGEVTALVPARLHGHPDTWAPSEGGDCEITAVKLDEQGAPLWTGTLTPSEEDTARELLTEQAACDAEDDDGPDPDDAFDDRDNDYPCPEVPGW